MIMFSNFISTIELHYFYIIERLQGDSRLAILYYTKKILFLLTSLYQLVLVGRFLGFSNTLWGFDSINQLRNGQTWEKTGIFPRVTMCDFQIRNIAGPPKTFTIQCVLMANMINEKIFLGMYCWICILLAITIVNLFQWWNNLSNSSNRVKYIYNALIAGHSIRKIEAEAKPEYDQAQEFTEFMTVDGVLIFRLMEINSSCLISNDVLYEVFRIHFGLFDEQKQKEREQEEQKNDDR
uniref:Innexin n=1 Tax=Bursaphelenchus xylophilus TaxID=6326 RepID=A0A1I7SGE5_BURXY